MRETEYAFAVAYTRTLENKMLSAGELESLLQMDSFEKAARFLSDRGYFKDPVEGKASLDRELKRQLEEAWEAVREAAPKDAPIFILLYQNDFYNLKTVLKCQFSKTPWEPLVLTPSNVEPELLAKAVSSNKFGLLPEFLQEPGEEAYRILSETNDAQQMELFLDRAYFGVLDQACGATRDSFWIGWAKMNADFANMSIALRVKQSGKNKDFLENALIPYGTISLSALADARDEQELWAVFAGSGYPDGAAAAEMSVSAFEKWCDNRRSGYLSLYKNKAFGPEPLVGFLLGKQREIQSLRIILYGLLNGIEKEILRERLRESYA